MIGIAVFPLLLALSLPGFQSNALRPVADKSSVQVDPAAHRTDRVVVKFSEGSGIHLREGRFVELDSIHRSPAGLSTLQALARDRSPAAFFKGMDAQLDAIDAKIKIRFPGRPLPGPNLRLYFEFETKDITDSRQLIARLNALDLVEIAYPREKITVPPGDIPPVTPNFETKQLWRNKAPIGIDAFSAQRMSGGWGNGLTVLDIEWGWWFDHEDLSKLRPKSLLGPTPAYSSYNNHGTAVIGELTADVDAWGVSGVTPDVAILCASDYTVKNGYSVAKAIVVGLPSLAKGDVMLLEAQTRTPLGLGPTEYIQADFDAIVKATQAGILTVEAAGNGNANLDATSLARKFDLTFRDSGAMIVGATEGSALSRASFSSYGSRIDANGWGRNVTTTGYGLLYNPGNDRKQRYTTKFSGTSSASPMVTSTVVALVATAKAQLSKTDFDKFIDYKNIRKLLRTHGTPLLTGQKIGLRPDLDKLMTGAGLERGLRIVDSAKINSSFKISLEADFAAGSSDAWLLLAAAKPANIGLSLFGTGCDRLLLDPLTMFTVTVGSFATGKTQTLPISIPNVASLKYTRFHWQALTLRGKDSRFCLSSASMSFILP